MRRLGMTFTPATLRLRPLGVHGPSRTRAVRVARSRGSASTEFEVHPLGHHGGSVHEFGGHVRSLEPAGSEVPARARRENGPRRPGILVGPRRPSHATRARRVSRSARAAPRSWTRAAPSMAWESSDRRDTDVAANAGTDAASIAAPSHTGAGESSARRRPDDDLEHLAQDSLALHECHGAAHTARGVPRDRAPSVRARWSC